MSSLRSSAGFSAIELLVVLAIAGSLAAMSVPFSMQMVDDYRISGDAHDLSNSVAPLVMSWRKQESAPRMDQ